MKILLNCLQNLDKQVKVILAHSNNEKLIKGEKNLSDLTESINFMAKKTDDYEEDRTEKEKLIKDLKEEVSYLKNEHEQLKSDVEKQERNTLAGAVSLFTVFPKNKGKVQIVLF